MPKPKRTFADIAAARKKYNPEVEGYGTPAQWQQAFYQRMGFEEAQRVRAKAQGNGTWRSEYRIIGEMAGEVLGENSMWGEIKAAFRKAALNCHPDRAKGNGMSEESAKVKFQEVQAAYAILAERYGE